MPASSAGDDARGWLAEALSQRRALNRLITEYAHSKELPYVDLFAATADPDSLELAADYSNDGVHFTTDGYRRFAMLLYEQVFSALPKRGD
jgi:lysophospholipase L1-like esterase